MTPRCDIPGHPHEAPRGAGPGCAATWAVGVIVAAATLADVIATILTPLPVAALLPPPPPVVARTPAA